MKTILLLLLLAAFAAPSCTTLANRRDIYRPGKSDADWQPYGEWEKKEKNI